MQKISESSVEVLYNEFNNLGKRITEEFKQIETTEESSGQSLQNGEAGFTKFFSICGTVVSLVTMCAK